MKGKKKGRRKGRKKQTEREKQNREMEDSIIVLRQDVNFSIYADI